MSLPLLLTIPEIIKMTRDVNQTSFFPLDGLFTFCIFLSVANENRLFHSSKLEQDCGVWVANSGANPAVLVTKASLPSGYLLF